MNSRYSPITPPSVAANEMSVGNPDKSIVNWVRSAAIPLATVEPRQGYKDLEALRAVIGNARIVSFGEATHGTREIRTLKHRMLVSASPNSASRCSVSRHLFPNHLLSIPLYWTGPAMPRTRFYHIIDRCAKIIAQAANVLFHR